VLDWLEAYPTEILVTAGAGDIDRLAVPIQKFLSKQVHAS